MDWLTFEITIAIRLSLQVYHEPNYLIWAHGWLDGSDKSSAAAAAAAYTADAVAYAADAATAAAGVVDAYAAAAAAYAARSINGSIRLGAKLEAVVKLL